MKIPLLNIHIIKQKSLDLLNNEIKRLKEKETLDAKIIAFQLDENLKLKQRLRRYES